MTTNTATQTQTGSAKQEYANHTSAPNVNAAVKSLSDSIVKTLQSHRVPTTYAKLTKQIEEASVAQDIDALLKLGEELKSVKENEKHNKKVLEEIRSKHSLAVVLQAFAPEFDEVIHEVALQAFKAGHTIATSRKGKAVSSASGEGSTRGPRKVFKYEITTDKNKVIDFPIKQGPKGNLDFEAAKDAYKELGFTVKGGKIEPETIKLENGSEVPTSRTNLIDAIKNKTGANFKGFSVKKVEVAE